MTTISERLMFLMEKHDMKQTELAKKVGISKQTLYKYLHCKCEPRAEIIAKMAISLDTTADFLVGLTNDPSPKEHNDEVEKRTKKGIELFTKLMKLSPENQIRIEERVNMIIENEELN